MIKAHWLVLALGLVLACAYGLKPHNTVMVGRDSAELDLEHWDFNQYPAVSLVGKWTFFPDQLIYPSELKQAVENWPSVLVQSNLPWQLPSAINQGVQHGVGTYILELTLPQELRQGELSLLHDGICSSSKLFIFSPDAPVDKALNETGKVSSKPQLSIASFKPGLTPISTVSGNKQVVLIQVANWHHRFGGLCRGITLAKTTELFHQQGRKQLRQGMLIAIIFSIALYTFATYTFHPGSTLYFWMGLWCAVTAIYFWTRSGMWNIVFPLKSQGLYEFWRSLEYTGLQLISPVATTFFYQAFDKRYLPEKLIYGGLALVICCCFLFWIFPAALYTQYLVQVFAVTLFFLGLAVYILVRATIDNIEMSATMLISTLPLLVAGPLDYQRAFNNTHSAEWTQYAVVFLVLMQCLFLGRKLASATNTANKLSSDLEEEIKQQTSALEEKNRQLVETHKALEDVNQELQALSVTDGLTGAYNRLYFDRQFLSEWQRSRREQETLSLLLLDIDHFKELNDTYGHLCGDECLKAVTDILHQGFRRGSDIVCRYGGEEFVVLLPNTTETTAMELAEHIRAYVENTPLHVEGKPVKLTVSIGVGSLIPLIEHEPLDLLSATDQALYYVKRNGRNGVHQADIEAKISSLKS